MTRLLTLVALATVFTTTAMAGAAPDIPEAAPAPVCDSADFDNKGQWVKCLVHSGVRGKDLARRIHDEHAVRKGVEPSERSKERSKQMARRAEQKAKQSR